MVLTWRQVLRIDQLTFHEKSEGLVWKLLAPVDCPELSFYNPVDVPFPHQLAHLPPREVVAIPVHDVLAWLVGIVSRAHELDVPFRVAPADHRTTTQPSVEHVKHRLVGDNLEPAVS